jgi:hypothetical protein
MEPKPIITTGPVTVARTLLVVADWSVVLTDPPDSGRARPDGRCTLSRPRGR